MLASLLLGFSSRVHRRATRRRFLCWASSKSARRLWCGRPACTGAGLEGRERSDGPLCRPEAYTTREIPSPRPSLRWLRWLLGFSSRVHRRATRPAVPAAASAVDCGAGVPPARGWVGGGESGPMDRYAGRRPTPQERFPPRTPLSGGSAGCWAFQAGFTGAPLVPRSPRPHRQLIVVRASRLHGAGLEGERAVRWTAMQAGGLHTRTTREIPSPHPSLRWLAGCWAFSRVTGAPLAGPRGRIGS